VSDNRTLYVAVDNVGMQLSSAQAKKHALSCDSPGFAENIMLFGKSDVRRSVITVVGCLQHLPRQRGPTPSSPITIPPPTILAISTHQAVSWFCGCCCRLRASRLRHRPRPELEKAWLFGRRSRPLPASVRPQPPLHARCALVAAAV
jgi:hypothetical protein